MLTDALERIGLLSMTMDVSKGSKRQLVRTKTLHVRSNKMTYASINEYGLTRYIPIRNEEQG